VLADALDTLPLAVVRVGARDRVLTADVSLRGFRPHLPKLVEKLLPWLEQVGADGGTAYGSGLPRILFDR
jgi:hypothetical protein